MSAKDNFQYIGLGNNNLLLTLLIKFDQIKIG